MSAGLDIGSTHALRSSTHNQFLKDGDPGYMGGGTITATNTQPTLEMYENIFGPAGRDVKIDSQRHKRHQRWHLPDALKGHNQFLTDRIDGLITDATNSPFTRNILPYKYLENPDQKLKWNVYSFDEGIASRVPYEAAARVLPQSKRSFAGYTVRQGLAIAMEHNFMMSDAGRANFKNQLTQLVGSIQLTNDLDVHIALLQAPSHQKYMNERYHDQFKTSAQICREYVDLFGIMQKTTNALDILIEDAKNTLKTWGSPAPTFLMCNGALTTQLTMTPEATNYITNGPDGKANLKKGPDLPSYRGLSIINSRKFSMDAGTAPRDLLRRRVRVGEYYHIVWSPRVQNMDFEFYDQSRDTMFRLSYKQLLDMSKLSSENWTLNDDKYSFNNTPFWTFTTPRNNTIEKTQGRGINVEAGGIVVMPAAESQRITGQFNGSETNLRIGGDQGGMLFYPALQWYAGHSGGKFRFDTVDVKMSCSLPSSKCESVKLPRFDVMSEAYGGGIFRHPFDITGEVKDIMRTFTIFGTPGNQTLKAKAALLTPFANISAKSNNAGGVIGPMIERDGINSSGAASTFVKIMALLPKELQSLDSRNDVQYTTVNMDPIGAKLAAGTWLSTETEPIRNTQMHILSGTIRDSALRLSANLGLHNLCLLLNELSISKTGNGIASVDFIKDLTREEREQLLQEGVRNNYTTLRSWAAFEKPQSEAAYDNARALARTLQIEINNFLGDANINLAFNNTDESLETTFERSIDAGFPGDPRGANFNKQALVSFARHIGQMRSAWSATVCSKFITYWLNTVSRNNTFTAVNNSNMVQMFKEYDEMFETVVLSEYAYFINANTTDTTDLTNESIPRAFTYSQNTSAGNPRRNMTEWIVSDDPDPSNAGRLDMDSVKANLCMLNALIDGNSHIEATMPMPNLHLGSSKPLKAADAEFSASSINSSMWMIQAVAGMTNLDTITCERILSKQTTDAIGDSQNYKEFLLPNAGADALNTNLWNSFLMHWFMSYFHPIAAERTEAASKCNISEYQKAQLCEALRQSLDDNNRQGTMLNQVLQNIVNQDFSDKYKRYSVAVGSPDISVVRTYITNFEDSKNACTFRKTSYCDTSVHDVDGFNKVKYTAARENDSHDRCLSARIALANENMFCDMSIFDPHKINCAGESTISGVNKEIYAYEQGVVSTDFDKQAYQTSINNTWLLRLRNSGVATHSMPCDMRHQSEVRTEVQRMPLYVQNDAGMQDYVNAARAACQTPGQHDEIVKHLVLVLFARCFEHGSRFMCDGKGIGVPMKNTVNPQESEMHSVRNGLHFMHGPYVPSPISAEDAGFGAKDLVILRPNIEHEMLGIIMGRGGTQELGCTFWGQTELSCYDDAQHGIWGMSYKYHERAMVTNEKNLIRVFDVSFDGYNGGMDQTCVDWNDPESLRKFSESTYARDRPYTGPSMLVMALPHNPSVTRCNWPNPIVFHENTGNNPTPDPQKDNLLPTVNEFMVFNNSECPRMCTKAQETAYKAYMNRLGMHQWSSLDASSRPAGEACIANEASTHMLAFQGTMKTYDQNGGLVEHIQGSGHLGPSYVGVASIREGRGLQNVGMAPHMIRQI